MILTEADLHAYNAGELSPEAVRVLEDDPLAVQDAARLRALSATLRDEAPIPVVGRAETIERLRRSRRSRIGVPVFVWAFGTVAVVALVAVSIPKTLAPAYVVRPVSYVPEAEATERSNFGSLRKQAEPQSAMPAGAASVSADTAAPRPTAPAFTRSAAPTVLEVPAKDHADALRIVREALDVVGGTSDDESTPSMGSNPRRIRVHVPASRYAAFAAALSQTGREQAGLASSSAESTGASPSSPGPMRRVEIRWVSRR